MEKQIMWIRRIRRLQTLKIDLTHETEFKKSEIISKIITFFYIIQINLTNLFTLWIYFFGSHFGWFIIPRGNISVKRRIIVSILKLFDHIQAQVSLMERYWLGVERFELRFLSAGRSIRVSGWTQACHDEGVSGWVLARRVYSESATKDLLVRRHHVGVAHLIWEVRDGLIQSSNIVKFVHWNWIHLKTCGLGRFSIKWLFQVWGLSVSHFWWLFPVECSCRGSYCLRILLIN